MKKGTFVVSGLLLLYGIALLRGDDQPSGFPLKLHVTSGYVGHCFVASGPNEAAYRKVQRDTGGILGLVEFYTGYGPGDAKAKQLAEEWNPVFATQPAAWTQFVRLQLLSRRGATLAHEELSVQWVRYTRPPPGATTLRYFDKQEDPPGAWCHGVGGTFVLRPVRGGPFPEGEYKLRATYDSMGNVAGLARIRKSTESEWFALEKPKTDIENLELEYELAQQVRHHYRDPARASKALQALLPKHPNNARLVAAMMGCCLDMGDDEQALVWARRYQEVFEKKLDPLWFTAEQFKKAGWPEEAYDMRPRIRMIEGRIEEKKWRERMKRK